MNYPLFSFVHKNEGIGLPNPATVFNPNIHYFYRYMNALWNDGTPLTRKGNGYNPTRTDFTKFAYDSNPNDTSAWTMRTAGLPELDVKGLGNIYLNKLYPQENVTVDMAITRHFDASKKNINEQIDKMYMDFPNIQNFYNQKFTQENCLNSKCLANDCVYPGDTNKDGWVNIEDLFNVYLAQNKKGNPRNATPLWLPQDADNWQDSVVSGVNLKHVDCDGDGTILLDKEKWIIDENYGKINSFYYPKADNYLQGDNLVCKTLSKIDSLNVLTFADISFRTNFNFTDTTVWALSFEMDYDNSIFNLVNYPNQRGLSKYISKAKHGEFHFSAYSTMNYLMTLRFRPEIIKQGKVPTNCTFLKFKNINAIRKDGSKVDNLSARDVQICFNSTIVNEESIIEKPEYIFCFPNPTTSSTLVENKTLNTIYYKLYDINSKILQNGRINAGEEAIIELNEYQQGVYILKVDDGKKQVKAEKLIKI